MKAFIFDMDGVIIDSEPIHFEIDVQTMDYFGVAITPKELEVFVGMTNPEMWKILRLKYNLSQTVAEMIDYQLTSKIERLRSIEIHPIAGINELIAALKTHHIPLAIASSSPKLFIDEVLLKFNIQAHFGCIISGEEVAKGKPEPDIYIEAARALGVDPAECVVIEDSRNGVQAAKSAGMTCIGFINPNSGNQDLSKADMIINAIRDINVAELLKV